MYVYVENESVERKKKKKKKGDLICHLNAYIHLYSFNVKKKTQQENANE
jgi:hypothetical protein